MGAIPEGDACFGKQVGNGHHCRTDDSERVFDAVHLKNFYKSLLRGHSHFSHFNPPFLFSLRLRAYG
jgi:hypothetical protein